VPRGIPKAGQRAKGAGRPRLGGEPGVRISVVLPPELAAWVKQWPEGASYFVRGLIEQEYRRRSGPGRAGTGYRHPLSSSPATDQTRIEGTS
jgi:hypothetical protein